MAKKSELQKISQLGYQLLALTKAAQFSAEELDFSESAALFELAYNISDSVVVFLQNLEEEESRGLAENG